MSIDQAMAAQAILMHDQSTSLIRGKNVFSPTEDLEPDVVMVGFRTWNGGAKIRTIKTRAYLNALGRTIRKQLPTDLQSGIIQTASAACEQAASEIRSAFQLSPREALRTIGTIWESLEKTGQLAEARTRFCLPKLPEPPLADSPDWLAEQLEVLSQPDEGLAPSHPLAIESAEKLIRACMHSSNTEAKADVQKVPLGNVLVDWNVEPHSLHWEVEAARLPWPGVKVNAMVVDNSGDKPQTHTRIFHTAFEVIEHFNEQLHEFGIQDGLH